ncbi:sulfatase [Halobaculum halobium]|uniref:Sulfatase n=1 Tax=Halobaculum halobium TaxID=3032281 RepID=A0ABD5T954_9EURY|nr:sulfatase [Halobaculum sp. SYNS20]
MADRPDVLFVILDSARRDRVSLYGHDRPTTPTLDALAEEATTFENAYTPTPWTLPSHCSMFTGKFPSEHGVTNGFADRRPALPASTETLAERLSERGYRTAGFSNNPWVGKLSGLDRGFEEFVEWDLEIGRESGAGIHSRRDRAYSRAHSLLAQAARQPVFLLKRPFFTDSLVTRAREWVETTADDPQPTFTFLNVMEAHSPYFPPDEAFEELGLTTPGPIEPRLLNTRLLAYVLGKADLAGDDRDRVLEYYDAALRYQDAKLAELLDTYRDLGLLEDTLVVICADHGKTLGDFPRDGEPSHYLRDLNTNVPMVVRTPGQRGGERVDDPVELRDLFGLIAEPGADVSSLAREHALTEDHIPHTGTTKEEVDRWRVISGRDHRLARSEDGEQYLFRRGESTVDERTIPSPERTEPAVLSALSEALDDRLADLTETDDHGDTDEAIGGSTEAQLRDLGYL